MSKDYRVWYPYNEVRVTKDNREYRVDSYIPSGYDSNGDYYQGVIVSRKYTQLADIKESTAFGYLNELNRKYSPGTEIIDGNFNSKELRGTTLSKDAQLVLQVPKQNANIPQNILNKAQDLNIIIEEVPDTVKAREEEKKSDNLCKKDD